MQKKKTKYWQIIILSIIPILLFVVALVSKQFAGPYWLGSNLDPEYAFLFNSLNVTQFKKIGHVDHPGTPLQVMGGATIAIAHLFNNQEGLVDSVLLNPEYYLNAINLTLTLLLMFSTLTIGILTLWITNKLLYSLLMQITPVLSMTSLWTLYRVSPEPLLLIVSMWLSFLVLYLYYQEDRENIRTTLILSILTGFSIAVKINSFPFIIIPFLLLPLTNIFIYLVSTYFSFMFFTLLINSQLKKFTDWIIKIITHSGRYGTGDTAVIDFNLFAKNIIQIYNGEKLLVVTIGVISLLLIFLFFQRKKYSWYRYLLVIFIFFVIQIFIVAKHFSAHYLIPALGFLGLACLFVIMAFDSIPNIFGKLKYVMIILLIFFGCKNLFQIFQLTKGKKPNQVESEKIASFIKEKYEGYTKIYYYRSSSIEYALNFGNGYSINAYEKKLNALYPRSIFYDIWGRTYNRWGSPVKLPTTKNVIYQGTPFRNSYVKYKPDIKLKDVYGGVSETIYLLENE